MKPFVDFVKFNSNPKLISAWKTFKKLELFEKNDLGKKLKDHLSQLDFDLKILIIIYIHDLNEEETALLKGHIDRLYNTPIDEFI